MQDGNIASFLKSTNRKSHILLMLSLCQPMGTAHFRRNGVETGSAATTVTSLLRHPVSARRERASKERTTSISSKTSKY